MKPESPNECDQDNNGLQELELVVSNCVEEDLLRTRRIQLTGEICEGTAVYVNTYLRGFALSSQSDPVFIYISSAGGDLYSGYSIIDQMQLCPFDVYTIVQGQACSMAAIIAGFGTIGCRFITRNSSVMIHEPIFGSPAQSLSDHKESVCFVEKDTKSKMKEFAKRTKLSCEDFFTSMKQTLWMSADEAITIGVVDGIWDLEKEQAVNNLVEEES